MPLINPNEVIWDDDAGGSIDPSQVAWDQPGTEVDVVNTKTGAPVDEFARLNKQLEDEALFGQRALEQSMDLGEKSRQYDVEHPTRLRDITQRLKSKGQVAAHMLTGSVAFPLGLAAGAGALIRGEGAKGFRAAQEKVGRFFTPDETIIGEMTPEAIGTLEAVGKVTGAPAKAFGAATAAIGGEGWRAAGEVVGDIALIGLPIMAKRAAHQYVGKGLKRNLSDLIEKNNTVGLTPAESAAMAESLINQAQGMKYEATGHPLNLWEKWKAKQGFSRMGEELRAAREGGPAEPFSPEFAGEVAGPKLITVDPAAFSPEDVPAGDIVGPLEPYSPELTVGIMQARQRASLPEPVDPSRTRGPAIGTIAGETERFSPDLARDIRQAKTPALPEGQGFEMVGEPFGPPPPSAEAFRGLKAISNLRIGSGISEETPRGTAHFEYRGETFEAPLPMGNSPIGNKYGSQWALDQIWTGKARRIKAPEASRTGDLPQRDTTTPVSTTTPSQPPETGTVPPFPARAKARKKAGKQKKEPGLLQWVKDQGGVWDKSALGEVRGLGTNESRTVGLVRKKTGRSLDELALLAVADWWLPKGSTSVEFLALLNDEISGKKATKLDAAAIEDDTETLNRYYDYVEPDDIEKIDWDEEVRFGPEDYPAPSVTPPPASGAPGRSRRHRRRAHHPPIRPPPVPPGGPSHSARRPTLRCASRPRR